MEDYRVTQTGDEIQEILNQSPIDTADIVELKEAATLIDGRLESVEVKIPAGASEENPLTDKQYVDDSIASASATFRGTYNEVEDLELTTAATHAEIAAALADTIDVADNNDYCFVQIPTSDATPIEIGSIERYKFVTGTGWKYEYTLNSSGFTTDQWAAINSGITSGLVTKLTDLPANAELTTMLNGKANAAEVYTKSETYNKTELDSMITTPDVQYVSVTATSQTTAVTDVLPATGSADTIYRVGSWDGTQYDANSYSEYAWNGTAYVPLSVKDAGIATGSDFDSPTAAQRELLTTVGAVLDGCDAEPTAGSTKLVQSGGTKEYVDDELDFSINYKSVAMKSADDDCDLSISDENGNELVCLKDGDIITKELNTSGTITNAEYDSSSDILSFGDKKGNIVLALDNEGNIKTKSFNSSLLSNADDLEPLIIGDLIQGSIGNHKINGSSVSLVSSSLAVPYLEAEFVVRIDNSYRVAVYCGYIDGDAGTYFPKNVGTFADGDRLTLPLYADANNTKKAEYIRLQISKADGSTITPSDNVNLSLLYDKKYSIIDSNPDIIDELQAKGTKKVSNKSSRGFYLTVVHGSDIHGDFERLKNLYLVADNIEADAVVLTGDLVAHNHYDYIEPLIALAKSHKVPTLICAGNHEVGFNYGGYNFEIDDAGVYDYVFSELSEYFEYQAADSVVSTVPYYYKDIPSKNVRVISLYQYINGAQDAGEGASSLRWDLHYNQTEMDWFCNTLASTPENYGIVLLIHTPELSQNGGMIQDNDLFFTYYNFGNVRSSVQNGQPVLEIIDAFISRGTLQKTYTQKGTPSSFTVDADFSEVPESIEFISQVSGHYHRDAIGLVNGAQERQVSLNISCTSGISYQSNSCDTPRNINNKTGDSFNVYVVNMETKAIDVYKIGAHYTTDNRNRTHMSIQYK